MGKSAKTFLVLAIVATISFCAWSGVRIVKSVSFSNNCSEYLKRAADATTVEMAQKEIGKAIFYAEENNLTEGIVSIFLKNPANDVGFWYENMKASYEELENLQEDATPMEKTNVLMKLRESLTDAGESGTKVTIPQGISIYPNNVAYFWWSLISALIAIVFWILCYIACENYWD